MSSSSRRPARKGATRPTPADSAARYRKRLRERLASADEVRGPTRNLGPQFDGVGLERAERQLYDLEPTSVLAFYGAMVALWVAIPALVLAVLNYRSRTRDDE